MESLYSAAIENEAVVTMKQHIIVKQQVVMRVMRRFLL